MFSLLGDHKAELLQLLPQGAGHRPVAVQKVFHLFAPLLPKVMIVIVCQHISQHIRSSRFRLDLRLSLCNRIQQHLPDFARVGFLLLAKVQDWRTLLPVQPAPKPLVLHLQGAVLPCQLLNACLQPFQVVVKGVLIGHHRIFRLLSCALRLEPCLLLQGKALVQDGLIHPGPGVQKRQRLGVCILKYCPDDLLQQDAVTPAAGMVPKAPVTAIREVDADPAVVLVLVFTRCPDRGVQFL